MTTLEQALNIVSQLPSEQQQMLVEIVQNRLIDIRRHENARDAKDALAAFHQGQLKPQPFEDIIVELRETLQEIE